MRAHVLVDRPELKKMGKLTCGCLNVTIHARKTDLKPIDVTQLDCDVGSHRFFTQGVCEVSLDLEGIKMMHESLVKEEHSGDFNIYRCCNCGCNTHAVQAGHGSNRILVNSSLKNDQSSIDRLRSLNDYSALYKIVLRSRTDNQDFKPHSLHSRSLESVQDTLAAVQEQLNTFLQREEAAVEERIRQYEEAQRAAYAELQSKARRDKHILINAILSASCDHQANQANWPSGQGEDETDAPVRFTLDNGMPTASNMRSDKAKREKHMSHIQVSTAARVPGNMDDDALFDLDGFHDNGNGEPFYESEGDDTDESSTNEDMSVPQIQSNRSIYSASVPISVPMWHTARHSIGGGSRRVMQDHSDDEDGPRDPERIAASIKALAQSVHEDGTEIFGDLPSSRRCRIGGKELGGL